MKPYSMTTTCIQCDSPFEISAREQERCEAMGFDLPQRCPDCRKHKVRPGHEEGGKRDRDKKKHYRMKYADARSGRRLR